MSEDVEPVSVKPTPVLRRFVVYGGVLLVVFLLGLVPMWLQSRASAGRLAEAERRLTLVGMQSNLASAAIDARRELCLDDEEAGPRCDGNYQEYVRRQRHHAGATLLEPHKKHITKTK